MPRPTREPASTSATDARLQSLDGKIDALTAAVERVADGLRVLLDVMADIREDVQWGVLNDKFTNSLSPMHITSMPKDPLAPDFGAGINRLKPADVPDATDDLNRRVPSPDPPRQADLF